MQQTYNFEALHDKGLAEHFLNAGKHLSGEVEVLGSAIRCIMLTGDNLSNKEIILQLIHALEITEAKPAMSFEIRLKLLSVLRAMISDNRLLRW